MATCLTACPDQWLCEQFCISVLDFLYMFTILQQDYVASTRITGSHYQMHPQNIRLGSIRVLVCIQFALHSRLPRRMSVRSLKTVLSYFQISFLKECGRASTRSELTNTFGILQLEEQVEPCNKFKLDYQFSYRRESWHSFQPDFWLAIRGRDPKQMSASAVIFTFIVCLGSSALISLWMSRHCDEQTKEGAWHSRLQSALYEPPYMLGAQTLLET